MKNILLFCLLVVAFNLRAQNPDENSTGKINVPDFLNLSFEKADQAIKAQQDLIRMGGRISIDYINDLLKQLRDPKLNNDNKTLAIYFLGSLSPTNIESIEFLIKNIDFKATKFNLNTAPQRWGDYPAEEALIKIGKPVIEPILNHLPTEKSELRRQLMCDVLKRVLR